ncbi:MAG: PEP-CTERM sorting domain-containing protein [Candidatus Omnitrophota bacterium]|jgi:hypothetical protein
MVLNNFTAIQAGWAQPATIELNVAPIHQNDYPDKLDNSNQSIASHGCTLTAHTMLINYALQQEGFHVKNEDGTQGEPFRYTPSDINRLLNDYRYEQKYYKQDEEGNYIKENGKYVVEKVETKNGWGVTIGENDQPQESSTEINVGSLRKAVAHDTRTRSFKGQGLNMTAYYAPGFADSPAIGRNGVTLDNNFTFILDQLEAGRPVIVRVRNNTHSVVVSSYHAEEGQPRGNGRYDIKDPWRNQDGTAILWLDDDKYKNLIFDYGVGVYKAGGLVDPYTVPSDFYIEPHYLYDPLINPDQYGLQVFDENHSIPEPATMLLLGGGIFILSGTRLINRKRKYPLSV